MYLNDRILSMNKYVVKEWMEPQTVVIAFHFSCVLGQCSNPQFHHVWLGSPIPCILWACGREKRSQSARRVGGSQALTHLVAGRLFLVVALPTCEVRSCCSTYNYLQILWDANIAFVDKGHQRKHDSLELEGTHMDLRSRPSLPRLTEEGSKP